MTCVFCDKIANEDTLHITPMVVAFEPLNPVTPGHMLFVPVRHVENFRESPALAGAVMQAASAYSKYRKEDFNIITSTGEAATQTVLHYHVHYVPRRTGDGLHLPWTGQKSGTP